MERTILSSIVLAGGYAGAAVGMPLSGLCFLFQNVSPKQQSVVGNSVLGILADSIAWNAPFYLYGVAGLIWSALWLWLSSEKPSTHSSISTSEKSHIEDSLGDSDAKPPTVCTLPWLRLLTSLPVHAIIFANFARGWTFYLLMVTPMKYFRERFGMNPGVLSSNLLPHIIMSIVVPLSGLLADLLRMRKVLTTTSVRKVFGCGGFGGEAVFLLLAAYANSLTPAIMGINLAVASSAVATSTLNANLLDVAPRQAAILTGFSNSVGTFAAMMCPLVLERLNGQGAPYAYYGDAIPWKGVFIFKITLKNRQSALIYLC